MFEFLKGLLGIGVAQVGKALGAGEKRAEGQARITEAEIAGAPASRLRLWRSALGWLLVGCFAWEVIGRAIITTYFPEAWLPPSALKEVVSLLCGMLGLGL